MLHRKFQLPCCSVQPPPGCTTRAAPTAGAARSSRGARPCEGAAGAGLRGGHQYPPGGSPSDAHPERYGKLVHHRCYAIDGVDCVVHSTERSATAGRSNVVEQRHRPAWVGYYHHKPSGKRLRAANSPNALELAQPWSALNSHH